ncbi:MAG TPA: hypothetical protein VLA34_04120 [Candidatus Krumholzibacterium sp.]|nr:hypothetical protein [Candidatus Krumholzibacterium sp.]
MNIRSVSLILLVVAAGFVFFAGCEKAVSPDSSGLTDYNTLKFGDVTYDTLYLKTGNGECGGLDSVVTLRYSPVMAPVSWALIGGGSEAPECSCDSIALLLPGTLPVTTMLPADSVGWFDVSFELPALFRDVRLQFSVIANDGAEILVNDNVVGQIDLLDGAVPAAVKVWDIDIMGDSLFVEGMNVLTFMVVNTGTGYFGEPAARVDIADCMYLAFDGMIDFAIDDPCRAEIDIKPGSEENPINCKSMNGVIPVAILTTECFDASIVDHTTVTFGPAGAFEAHSNKHGIKRHVEDVDFDGDLDLVFHFRGYETGIVCGDTLAVLRGMTWDGLQFEAAGRIRTVPWGECDPDTTVIDD